MSDDNTLAENKRQLTPAHENPYYHLLNWHGQPKSFDDEIIKQNTRFWHQWIYDDLTEDQIKELINTKIVEREGFAPFTTEEKMNYVSRLKLILKKDLSRDYGHLILGIVDLASTCFDSIFCCKNYIFPKGISFTRSTFNVTPHFENSKFIKFTNIADVTFVRGAHFSNASFLEGAIFENNKFSKQADFSGATLKGVNFNNVMFTEGACFEGVIFLGMTKFSGSTEFNKGAYFGSAIFSKSAKSANIVKFENTVFKCQADFNNIELCSKIHFEEVIFEQGVDFTLANFQGELHANEVTYKKLPIFSSLSGIIHPFSILNSIDHFIISENAIGQIDNENLQTHENTFAALKNKALEIHQDVFVRNIWAMELLLRRQQIRGKDKRSIHKFLKIITNLFYDKAADYGRSYVRPFLCLMTLIAIGIIIQFCFQWMFYSPFGIEICTSILTATDISVSNSLLFLTPWKSTAIDEMNGWVKLLSLIQSICSFILIFLIGLGLRNEFKIK